jgi:hypothetical protein
METEFTTKLTHSEFTIKISFDRTFCSVMIIDCISKYRRLGKIQPYILLYQGGIMAVLYLGGTQARRL